MKDGVVAAGNAAQRNEAAAACRIAALISKSYQSATIGFGSFYGKLSHAASSHRYQTPTSRRLPSFRANRHAQNRVWRWHPVSQLSFL
jgi:hypothetical protein